MKDFLAQNKKFFAGVIIIIAMLAVLATLVRIMTSEEQTTLASSEQHDTLPVTSQITSASNPVMYDFLLGYAGYKSHPTISQENIYKNGFLFVAFNTSDPTALHVSVYNGTGDSSQVLARGYSPITITDNLDDNIQWVQDNAIQQASESEPNGNYVFYIVTDYTLNNSSLTFGNYSKDSISDYLYESQAMNDFNNGVGVPSDFLRLYPHAVSSLLENEQIDITSSFWDTYNYRSTLRLPVKQENSSDTSTFDLYLSPGSGESFTCLNNNQVYYLFTEEQKNDKDYYDARLDVEVLVSNSGVESLDYAVTNGLYVDSDSIWNDSE